MKQFAALFAEIDQTTSTNEKVDAMVRYFGNATAEDVTWAAALLTGRRPPRPVKTAQLRQWAVELSGVPAWLFDECYSVVGDLSETISLLVPGTSGEDRGLSPLMLELLDVAGRTDEEKRQWLADAWRQFSRDERFIFNKLMAGNFRVGVSQQLVFRALAKVFGMDERQVAHRLMGNWSPMESNVAELLSAEAGEADHSRPYPFYLAYQLDVAPPTLGDPSEWQIERKYDGIRGQIIVRGGQVHTWSRGEELMTEKFTEFNGLAGLLPPGTVLDGEVVAYRDGRILPFGEMQKRIGRKKLTPAILSDVPLRMICYDLLEWQGGDIRDLPLRERRRLLEELIVPLQDAPLLLSPAVPFASWDELPALREESRQLGCEGLMLKHLDSVYETGRRRGKWWKWKVDPFTVDAVMIYAQAGHGRRANLFTDYTFAVWDGDALVPFAKAYSGLTDKEIAEVDAWVKRNTIEKFGPVRSVKPEQVFEIAFEGINASPRHKSGIALRFPRIARWRRDKKAAEANTRGDLLQLLHAVNNPGTA